MERRLERFRFAQCLRLQWDGRESVDSYLRTLRRCYGAFCDRFEEVAAAAGRSGKAARFTLDRL